MIVFSTVNWRQEMESASRQPEKLSALSSADFGASCTVAERTLPSSRQKHVVEIKNFILLKLEKFRDELTNN